MKPDLYPLCTSLGLNVYHDRDVSYVRHTDLQVKMVELDLLDEFSRAFGRGHTMIEEGAFPCDVERALYTLKAKKLLPAFSPLPSWGDLMTRQDFVETVECGGFIDYDGDGHLATETQCSDISICPSMVKSFKWPVWATHVVWYNK